MKPSWNIGLNFGLTSGVLTTLGLIVGLYAGTHSRTAVLGGILTIAVSDSLSDAMGIHLAEESTNIGPVSHVWEATAATFLAKFGTALTFAVPLAIASLSNAILISVMWGLSLVTLLSFLMARAQRTSPWIIIGEHLLFTLCVVTLSYYAGEWVRAL
ncbi:MAG TPA: hypothetical protein VJ746_10235 [Nitrospira sp.]|nr:hypothetical protein [Nitrospira sp.]